jgi:hypothetical protein
MTPHPIIVRVIFTDGIVRPVFSNGDAGHQYVIDRDGDDRRQLVTVRRRRPGRMCGVADPGRRRPRTWRPPEVAARTCRREAPTCKVNAAAGRRFPPARVPSEE